MKRFLRYRVLVLLCMALGIGIVFSGVTQAQITVSDPVMDVTTGGNFVGTYGECFFLLANPNFDRCEEEVGPASYANIPAAYRSPSDRNGCFDSNNPDDPVSDHGGPTNVCFGNPTAPLNTLPVEFDGFSVDDFSVYRVDNAPDQAVTGFMEPDIAFAWSTIAGPNGGQYASIPCTKNLPLDTDRFTTFDSEFVEDTAVTETVINQTGSITLAYYFVNAADVCRVLMFELFVNGNLAQSGTIGDFQSGKYLVFEEIVGLTGPTTIRLETTLISDPEETPTVCGAAAPIPGINSHLSGVFISNCEPEPPCSIGDYVWEDANRDGCQDPDEDPIEGVEVKLFEDCGDPAEIASTTTNAEGFYEFTGLDCSKEYRVQFGPAGAIYDYTIADQECVDGDPDASDMKDSDCNEDNGFSGCVTFPDPVNNPNDPTIDCGYVCEGKIGDYVWLDFNGTPGCQDPEEPGIDGVIVNLFEVDGCPDVQGQDPFMTTTTVNEGEYLFEGLCPGDYRVTFEDPLGRDNTVVDQSCEGFPPFPPPDTKDSDCGGDGECVTLTKDTPEDPTIDCGKVPPCELAVEKFCSVPPPPSADLECDAKIAATTLRYIGPDISNATVVFSGKNNKADGGVTYNVDLVSGVTVLTSAAENGFTIDERPEDLGSKMTISIDDVEEVIHTSCSTPYVAGQPAPLDNPKGEPSPNWFVVNFVDKEGNFSGIPDSDPPDLAELCEVVGVKPGSCEDGKPTSLTFIYTGDDCTASDNEQGDKAKCEGDPAGAQPVQVVYTGKKADKFTVTPADQSINVGDSVTITTSDKFEANTKLEVRQGGRSLQDLEIHTSCSQPLAVGDQFGSLLLSQFVPQGGAAVTENVLYTYRIRNNGVTAVTVDVVDDQLGPIAENLEIPAEGQVELTEGALLSETTTNIVTVTEVGDPNCFAEDSVKVTVEEPPVPPGSCEDGKPVELTFRYTGDGCGASNNNQGDKAKCEGDPAGAQPVQVVYTGKNAGKFTVTPADESIMVDDEVTITTTDKFEANTKLEVRQGGRSLQDLEIHTSCSQPLAVGDQFGSLILEAFVPKP